MATLLPPPITASQKAIQYFFAILSILIIGKLITIIPVMDRLQLAGTYKAAQIAWLGAKLSALVLFYYFARATITAIPNNGSLLPFIRNITGPLTILVIVIIGQELLWQLLEPFVQTAGKKIYYSLAIIVIIAISIWLVFRAYQSALYLSGTGQKIVKYISKIRYSQYKACTDCGHQIKNDAKFCSQCGLKILDHVNCSECGQLVSVSENFCQHCGAKATLTGS